MTIEIYEDERHEGGAVHFGSDVPVVVVKSATRALFDWLVATLPPGYFLVFEGDAGSVTASSGGRA